ARIRWVMPSSQKLFSTRYIVTRSISPFTFSSIMSWLKAVPASFSISRIAAFAGVFLLFILLTQICCNKLMQLYCNSTNFIYICQMNRQLISRRNFIKWSGLLTAYLSVRSNLLNISIMQTGYEVIIIGGSYAGLSAGMALGRASRNILIIDSNLPCNRHTPHSHNFITLDGETPAAISEKAKQQVLRYPTVTFLKDKAVTGTKANGMFTITTQSGKSFTTSKLLFATGVTDIMPPIGGIEDCWGIS